MRFSEMYRLLPNQVYFYEFNSKNPQIWPRGQGLIFLNHIDLKNEDFLSKICKYLQCLLHTVPQITIVQKRILWKTNRIFLGLQMGKTVFDPGSMEFFVVEFFFLLALTKIKDDIPPAQAPKTFKKIVLPILG